MDFLEEIANFRKLKTIHRPQFEAFKKRILKALPKNSREYLSASRQVAALEHELFPPPVVEKKAVKRKITNRKEPNQRIFETKKVSKQKGINIGRQWMKANSDNPNSKKKQVPVSKNSKSPEFYQLHKIKERYLKKNINIGQLEDHLEFRDGVICAPLRGLFPGVSRETKITAKHLAIVRELVYDRMKYLDEYYAEIVTKNPKTRPNYYKLIYTK